MEAANPISASRSPRRGVLYSVQIFLLNHYFWCNFLLTTLVFVVVAFPCIWLYHQIVRNPRKTVRVIRVWIYRYGLCCLRCGWPAIRPRYVDLAPDEKPPFVFISNHRSASDGFLTSFVRLEAVQVLNIWPAHVPLMGFLVRVAGYLRVREMPFEDFLRDGSKLLQDGCSIVAFPEGTRSGSTRMGKFHGSTFRLAQHNKVKIVPLVIEGSEDKPTRGGFWMHPGVVTVTKLPSITQEEYEGMSAFTLKNHVRDRIAAHLDSRRMGVSPMPSIDEHGRDAHATEE